MGKKLLLVAMALALAIAPALTPAAAPATAHADADYTLLIDGAPIAFDPPPQLIGNTMMVPLRSIANALNVTLDWQPNARTITASKDETTVTIAIGETNATKNDESIALPAAPVIENEMTLVPLRFFSQAFGMIVKWDGIRNTVSLETESAALPVVGTFGNLQHLLDGLPEGQVSVQFGSDATVKTSMKNEAAAAPASGAMESKAAAGAADYSTTNVQVEGVDEADVVKTDGAYIYQVNHQRVVIAEAYPADKMRVVATIPFADRQFQPQELYVDGNRLIVIGNSYTKQVTDAVPGSIEKKIAPPRYNTTTAKAIIYDIANKSDVRQVREVELQGNYLTSRKIGSSLYVLANQYVNVYAIQQEKSEQPGPMYRDTAGTGAYVPIGYDRVRYFPELVHPSYLLVAGINLDQPDKAAQVNAYLGAGDNVYASQTNLYVTLTQQPRYGIMPMVKSASAAANNIAPPPQPATDEQTTTVYKFNLDGGLTAYAGSGKVPGSVLNQFAMDEQNGYFRIATTTGYDWTGAAQTNNIYVLNESLDITGKIEGIAPGEKIYSVRFMGNRGYMVTFKKVDPLFVIDLADPQAPKIVGQLKIPGYSDYLHPYDETHLIGFGKDAIEIADEPRQERSGADNGTPATRAYYQGMKIALFDVSDVSHPIELFKETIGDRGTDSELLRNHKALLFSKEKGLLAFPVTVAKVPDGQTAQNGFPAYGQFAFQGAYVYALDLQQGFRLRGTITHLSDDDMRKASGNGYDITKAVNRLLYIGDTLYTLSDSEIRASDLGTLVEKNRVAIP